MCSHTCRAWLISLVTLAFSCGRTLAAPGDLDTGFDGDGRVTTPIGGTSFGSGYDTVQALLVQPDGRTVTVGWANDNGYMSLALARYHPSGALDFSFGSGGVTKQQIAFSPTFGYAAALQSDGKIIVAGSAGSDFAVARFQANGLPDYSFGTDGAVVTSDFGIGTSGNNGAYAVAIQPDGKIVAAGQFHDSSNRAWFTVIRYLANGTLDTTFNSTGLVPGMNRASFGSGSAYARGMLIQNSGKIVLCGYGWDGTPGHTEDLLLMRFTAAGVLDTAFGNVGKTSQDLGGSEKAYAVAEMADGKLVTAGSTTSTSPQAFLLMRFSVDGVRDSSFGTSGAVKPVLGTGSAESTCLAVQTDGKVVAGGFATVGSGRDFALARFALSGALDASFGSGGKVTTSFGSGHDQASAMALQADGKILLGGTAALGNNDFALARYFSDGSPPDNTARLTSLVPNRGALIPAFQPNVTEYAVNVPTPVSGVSFTAFADGVGATILSNGQPFSGSTSNIGLLGGLNTITITVVAQDGITTRTYTITVFRGETGPGGLDGFFGTAGVEKRVDIYGATAHDVAVDPNGKIVTVGLDTRNSLDVLISRRNADGSTDESFGTNGHVTVGFAGIDIGHAVAVQPDGKILAVGEATVSGQRQFIVMRYLPTGDPDLAFGGTGYVLTDIGTGGDIARGVALQSDGRIVVCGSAEDAAQFRHDFAVVRYLSDGTLDASFGTGGRVITPGISVESHAHDLTLQSDGKIVVVGNDSVSFFVCRYLPDGILDTTFSGDGKASTQPGNFSYARSVALENNGSIILGGSAYRVAAASQDYDFALVRFLQDGSLDTSFGSSGSVLLDFQASEDQIYDIAIQVDGRIVAAGYARNTSSPYGDFALARFFANGSPDMSFVNYAGGATTPGKIVTPISPLDDICRGIALLPDGKIVAVGYQTNNAGTDSVALARYHGYINADAWRLQWFGSVANAGSADFTADPDHDGLSNHLEYAFGLDPTQHTSSDLLPQWWLNPGYVCELRFEERFGLIGTTFSAEWSTTLDSLDWHPITDIGTTGEHRFLHDSNGAPAVFFRLKVNGL